MSWVKLDDGFYSHPKARAAGKDGRALFLAGLCWTKRHLTDGLIPKVSGALLCAEAEVNRVTPERLVAVRLWHDEGDCWRINDFHDYQEASSEERKRKDDHAERMRLWRAEQKAKRDAERDAARDTSRDGGVTSAYTDTDTDTDISTALKTPPASAVADSRAAEQQQQPVRLNVLTVIHGGAVA